MQKCRSCKSASMNYVNPCKSMQILMFRELLFCFLSWGHFEGFLWSVWLRSSWFSLFCHQIWWPTTTRSSGAILSGSELGDLKLVQARSSSFKLVAGCWHSSWRPISFAKEALPFSLFSLFWLHFAEKDRKGMVQRCPFEGAYCSTSGCCQVEQHFPAKGDAGLTWQLKSLNLDTQIGQIGYVAAMQIVGPAVCSEANQSQCRQSNQQFLPIGAFPT